jgi:hypothetical protein
MKKGAAADRKHAIAEPTEIPDVVPVPPIFPLKREWRQAILEATGDPAEIPPDGTPAHGHSSPIRDTGTATARGT